MSKYVNVGGQWYSKKALKEIRKNGTKAKVCSKIFGTYIQRTLGTCVITKDEKV